MIDKTTLTVSVRYDEYDDFFYFKNSKNGGFLSFCTDKFIECDVEPCREEFRHVLDEQPKRIGFYYKNINIDLINEFFENLENQLGLKIKSVFTKVKIKNEPEFDNYIVQMKPSNFWMEDCFRRDFLSLFLRCAAVYYKGNFNKALDSYSLTRKIKPAIFHFLEGNVYPNFSPLVYFDDFVYEEFKGAVDTFKNKTKNQMRGYLFDFDISKC